MMANGMRRIAANSGTVVSTAMTATTLPRYIEAISPHTKSGRSMNSMGPGLRPQIMSPPIITAALAAPEVGATAREALGKAVAHERGGGRAAGRDAHPHADHAAAQKRGPITGH